MSSILTQKSSLCPTNGRQTLCAIYRAPATCTTTLLPSLADPGGVFDAPKAKCPPDRGSSDCVTGSPASIFSTTSSDFSFSSPELHYPLINKPSSIPPAKPNTDTNGFATYSRPVSCPRAIPSRGASSDLSTPPLTPDDDDDSNCGSFGSGSSSAPRNKSQEKDALDFLMNLFPHQGLQALPYARRVSISAPQLGAAFDGVVLELPGKPKTLYVDGKSAESVSLRESIVALLDLADESLGCSALVIVLERASPNLGALLHSLMYVGGTVVTKPVFQVDSAYVLVGLEI
ncbi:putative ornithine decarboxylase antizyme [Lyophyllum shimeji]|uniref:Ornithine decarboxylase antizyme n=1 Tax=Lyophyllum shimeji TaxID=47721 RepID=A0A9P3PJ45_LYOSH|nr:putative ornithine decarboxylase antizyme [Lyophyllum shimeji]